MLCSAPDSVKAVCEGLVYRDFITIGLLCRRLRIGNAGGGNGGAFGIKDNWIYIQDPGVALGRVQVFNNWSPWLVSDPDTVWLGLEYFASEGDSLWSMKREEFIDMAVKELVSLKFIQEDDVLDATLLKVKKAYPAYFGTYPEIEVVQEYLNGIPNLFPVGRNGMHRYNNMDHSMLSAMHAVSCIMGKERNKSDIWKINEEQEYHESK